MVYTSLLAYIDGFDFKEAIPIGSVIILVQNTILLIFYLTKRHPITHMHLIVFDNFLLLLPSIFSGNLIGYVLFVVFPKMLINILFGLTLSYFVYVVFQK
jgi:hypothetical protein